MKYNTWYTVYAHKYELAGTIAKQKHYLSTHYYWKQILNSFLQ